MLKTRTIETRIGRHRIVESTIDKDVGAAPLKPEIARMIRGEIAAETSAKDKSKAEEKARKKKAANKKKAERKSAAAQKKESREKSKKFTKSVFG